MHDAVADIIASRSAQPRLAPYLGVSAAAHILLLVALAIAGSRTEPAEQKKIINVRLSSGAAPAAARSESPRPASRRASPPPSPVQEATPVPMTRPVPPPTKPEPAIAPRKASAGETLFGKSQLEPAKSAVPTSRTPAQPAPPVSVPSSGSAAAAVPSSSTAPGTAGSTLPGIGKAGVMGLEGGPFPFNDYLERMIALIGRRWQRPAGGEPTATVYFIVERSGRIREAEIEESSGVGAFDRAALRAVLESSPLPPLPSGYREEWLGVHLAFH